MKRKNSLVDYRKFLEEEIPETVILLHIITVFHLNYRLYGKEEKNMEKIIKSKEETNFHPVVTKVYNFEEISGKNERATHSGGAEKHSAISAV